MTQLDARKEELVSSEFRRTSSAAEPKDIDLTFEQILPLDQAAQFVFCAPGGSVIALGGIDGAALREVIDQAEHIPNGRRALFATLPAARSVAAYVEDAITLLAEAALRLWPVWFGDVSFAMCGDNTLGRHAARAIVRETAVNVPGISATWAEAAAHLALAGCRPRVDGALPSIEIAQLSLTISRAGLVLATEANTTANAAALVHALEWIAQHSHAAIVVLFSELPSPNPPFDRILYGARRVSGLAGAGHEIRDNGLRLTGQTELWLAPWRGTPHPMSEIEQKLAAMLLADAELAPLFCFNRFVDTVRGSRPKVDLVWTDGRLVVELDGYPDHSTPRAFLSDRHRDYELALSGYTVLRLANEEIQQDFGRAIEKIRDVVRLRRSLIKQEG